MEYQDGKLTKPVVMVLSDENLLPALQRGLGRLDPAFHRPRDLAEAKDRSAGMDVIMVTLHLESGGIQAIRALREAAPDISIFVLSQSNQLHDVQSSLRAGADDYILSPYEPDEVLERVTAACQQLKALRERFGSIEVYTRQIEELKTIHRNTIQGAADLCLSTLRSRSMTLANHCRQVAMVAEKFATYLKWEPVRVEQIRLTGLLHDYGMIGLTESLLLNGPRSPQEQMLWKRHPMLAKQMLAGIFGDDVDWDALVHHHECFDGTGFPDQLSGWRLQPGARLLAIVNAFAGTVTPVFGLQSGTVEDAILAVMNGSGTAFDPELMEQFVKFVSEADLKLS